MKSYVKKLLKKKVVKSKRTYNKKPSMAIKQYVKQEIARDQENKIMSFEFSSTAQILRTYGQASWGTYNTFALSPYTTFCNTAQGAQQNARIGNKITIKKANLNLMFHVLPYDLTNNATPGPMFIQLITFYDKTNPNVLPSTIPQIFQNGSSSTDPNTLGLPVDMLKQINNDRYKVFTRHTFKLGNATYGGTGTSAIRQSYANNDFPFTHIYKLDYTKQLIHTVKYNDATTDPTTRGLFCALLVMSADGTTISTALQARYTGFIQIEYEDA